jgi:hypothetical protein
MNYRREEFVGTFADPPTMLCYKYVFFGGSKRPKSNLFQLNQLIEHDC